MSESDENSPDQTPANETRAIPGRARSNRARQLFGHTSGSRPWDVTDEAEPPVAGLQSEAQPADTSSAPYPRDAQYTPRAGEQAQEADAPRLADFFTEVDDEDELTRLHPNYKLLMRLKAIMLALVLAVIGILLDLFARTELGLPFGVIQFPAIILALFIAIRLPVARYNARGYQISPDRLRVVRGIWWHSDTIVPFGRVQHIDVDQTPIERGLDIATMTLHTAGSHNASVRLPGLGHALAIDMREAIRAHIKRETL